ncbi:hypothetical protein RYX36_031964 [Vicia faba]
MKGSSWFSILLDKDLNACSNIVFPITARGIPCYNKDVDCPENMCMYAHRPMCYLGFCKCVGIALDN